MSLLNYTRTQKRAQMSDKFKSYFVFKMALKPPKVEKFADLDPIIQKQRSPSNKYTGKMAGYISAHTYLFIF